MLKKEQTLGFIRHLLTFGAGIAVSKGVVDESTATEIVGGCIGILGILWSILSGDKKKGNGY